MEPEFCIEDYIDEERAKKHKEIEAAIALLKEHGFEVLSLYLKLCATRIYNKRL